MKKNIKKELIKKGVEFFNLFKLTVLKFLDDDTIIRASSLAYSTLLTVVPFATLIFVFSDFSNLQPDLENLLSTLLLPESMKGVMDTIMEFVNNGLELGTMGVIFFLITVVSLLLTIERQFDVIFRSVDERNLRERVGTYITFLLLGSLLIGGNALGIVAGIIEDIIILPTPLAFLASTEWLPVLFLFFSLLMLYTLMPNMKIQFRHAVIGATFGTLGWFISKWGFGLWLESSVRYSVIYGSLFVIPISFMWIYTLWIVVLFGAEIVAVRVNPNYLTLNKMVGLSPAKMVELEFELYLDICKNYLYSEQSSKEKLKKGQFLGKGKELYLKRLIKKGYIIQIKEGYKYKWIPAKSPDRIFIKEVIRGIFGEIDEEAVAYDIVRALLEGEYQKVADQSIGEFLEKKENSNAKAK